MNIEPGTVLGVDLGTSTCGWLILNRTSSPPLVAHHGVWTFEAPEKKDRKGVSQSINSKRRMFRGTRNRYDNRQDRLDNVRSAFVSHALTGGVQKWDAQAAITALDAQNSNLTPQQKSDARSPWKLRSEAFNRKLNHHELALALYHIAAHNGISWDTKGSKNKASKDKNQREYQNAVRNTSALLGDRTYGDVLYSDPQFSERKRNSRDKYLSMPHRDDLRREVKKIFECQREHKSAHASVEFEAAFVAAAFHREQQTSFAGLVADCPFEEGEKRTARFAYSNELRRLLETLNHISIRDGGPLRKLDPEQIKMAIADFPTQKRHSYAWLRRTLGLASTARFGFKASEIPPSKESRDVVMKNGDAGHGSKTLRDSIGASAWNSLLRFPEQLDKIAELTTFEKSIELIRAGLTERGLPPSVVDKVSEDAAEGVFDDFKGAAGISSKAARRLIELLRQGISPSDARDMLGYGEADTNPFASLARPATRKEIQNIVEPINPPKQNRPRALISSPVARKAFIEGLKQVDAICKRVGYLPERIHVELGREIGKSPGDRKNIADYQEKRGEEKDRRIGELTELLKPWLNGRRPSDREFLRYELLLEQNCRCLYSDDYIDPKMLLDSSHELHIDHILPFRRFQQDGFRYVTLCKAKMNIEKGDRTPFEWFRDERPAEWDRFKASVSSCSAIHHRKVTHLTIEDATVLEEVLPERAKDDTRKASKMLRLALEWLYPDDGRRHVFARPSELTGLLRKAWGINELKFEGGKRIIEDTHHAVDALVLAAVDNEGALNKLTQAHQLAKQQHLDRFIDAVKPPWQGFAADAMEVSKTTFVARAEKRRARGEGHAASLLGKGMFEGKEVLLERKHLLGKDSKLSAKDLDRIATTVGQDHIVDALKAWFGRKCPSDDLPKDGAGKRIKKVYVRATDKLENMVPVRGGYAERARIVRTDIFQRINETGRKSFLAVPIYPYQIFRKKEFPLPPLVAVPGGEVVKPEEFLFSIFPMSWVEIEKSHARKGTALRVVGYFRSFDANTGSITISPANSKSDEMVNRSNGIKTLKSFEKHSVDRVPGVDRLGRNTYKIVREKRAWREAK
jgi:CRISPR-associated endonuclease Csn1